MDEWAYTSGRFRAFDHDFGIRTTDPALGRYVAHVLDQLAAPGAPARWYSLEDRGPSEQLRYSLDFDDERELESASASRTLATLLWHINRHAVESCTDRVLIHAAAAEDHGRAVILPARMESGKTTLVAGLVRAGLRYLTDEAVAIDAETLQLHGLAKPLTIDAGSWEVLSDLEPEIDPDVQHYMGSWHVDVRTIRPDAISRSATPSFVILPKYERGATTVLTPLPRPLALMALCENSFNVTSLGQAGLDVLADTVRRSACYRLVVGELNTACDLVLDALARGVFHDTIERSSTPVHAAVPGSDVVSVEIEGESVLMNTRTGVLHHLDALGTAIWACCDGTASIEELAADVADAFDVEPERVRPDIAAFVRDLVRSGLLTYAEDARGPSRPVASE